MKMTHVLAKTGLALAISAMAAGAYAGDHIYTAVNGVNGTATILADEIFGTNSQETLVAIPTTTYKVANNVNNVVGNIITIKYTLNQGAVFGEDLSDIQKWADSNATLTFRFAAQTEDVGGTGAGYSAGIATSIAVDQGGAIGDNTVTFKIDTTGLAALTDIEVDLGQVRVKNLTNALQRGVNAPVKLGAEFRNVTANVSDTQGAIDVLSSQKGVELAGALTTYEVGGLRARINVANTEQKFTGDTGADAAQDFDADNSVGYVNLGTLQVVRTTYPNSTTLVKKENGDDFDFQGDDQPVVTLTSSAPLSAYSSFTLNPAGSVCGTTGSAVKSGTPTGNTVSINLKGQTTQQLQSGYTVCGLASGNASIPESTFSAALAVTYFNPRYTTSEDTLDYGRVLRNGCQVTLFNLPNVDAADKGMIRLTNVSENPGSVRAWVWTEDGRKIDVDSVLTEQLAAHATTVFHTNANLNNGVFLGDVLPEYAALTQGRHRLVLQGAFPACEALGMVRSPNGTLTNMTSTTFAGSEAVLGNNESNTSNTVN